MICEEGVLRVAQPLDLELAIRVDLNVVDVAAIDHVYVRSLREMPLAVPLLREGTRVRYDARLLVLKADHVGLIGACRSHGEL